MQIRRVDTETRSDVKRFVELPFKLYRDYSHWVPPMVSSEYAALNRQKHPFFEHSVAEFFIAECDGRTCGRIAVMENRNYNKYRHANEAFFGYFEAENDSVIVGALFAAARDWAWRRGLDGIQGPRALLAGSGASVMVDGFELRPPLGVPYNFEYYDALIQAAGFRKDTDYLSAVLDTSYELPGRLRQIADRAKQRRGFWIKSFASTREMRQWMPKALAAHQRAFAQNHTYFPPTPAEADMLVDTLLQVADPHVVKLVMRDQEIAGFVLGLRDVSAGLQRARGRLWPVGWYHVLLDRRRTRCLNLNGFGLLPEHRIQGGDAVLLTALDEAIRSTRFERAYLVQVEEGNAPMITAATHLGVTWRQRHRSYRAVV